MTQLVAPSRGQHSLPLARLGKPHAGRQIQTGPLFEALLDLGKSLELLVDQGYYADASEFQYQAPCFQRYYN